MFPSIYVGGGGGFALLLSSVFDPRKFRFRRTRYSAGKSVNETLTVVDPGNTESPDDVPLVVKRKRGRPRLSDIHGNMGMEETLPQGPIAKIELPSDR